MRESAVILVGMGEADQPTKLTVRGRQLVIECELGRGATSTVWKARDAVGPLVLKLGGSAASDRASQKSARGLRGAFTGLPALRMLDC